MLLVLPFDHHVAENQSSDHAIEIAMPLASQGYLTTFGLEPTRPETGYGYLLCGEPLPLDGCKMTTFIEKPENDLAVTLVDSGKYIWNSGILLTCADAYLQELCLHAPDILDSCKQALDPAVYDMDFLRPPSSKL